jgi:hypothetical protein
MSDTQDFTWEQLQRIENAVNFVLVSTGDPRALGTVVKDVLRAQDFMSALKYSKKSPSIDFLDLPAEIRNKIYRLCLVVGEVYPRRNPEDDRRLDNETDYEAAETQVFQLCRQIFAEAAPIYFAENKFVLSSGSLPWSHRTSDFRYKPLSKVAHSNLRSLSITFDLRDAQILPSDLISTNYGDSAFEQALLRQWRQIVDLVKHLDLKLLEVSLANCYCAFCHCRMTHDAVEYLRTAIRFSPRVVVKGLIDSDEVSWTRDSLRYSNIGCNKQGGPLWHPEFEDDDPKDESEDQDANDEFQVAFQVVID